MLFLYWNLDGLFTQMFSTSVISARGCLAPVEYSSVQNLPIRKLIHSIFLTGQWPEAGKDLRKFPGLWKFLSAVSAGLQLCGPKVSSVRALIALRGSASPSPLSWICLPVPQACPDTVWLGNLGSDTKPKSWRALGPPFFTEDLFLKNSVLAWAWLQACLQPALYHTSPHPSLVTWIAGLATAVTGLWLWTQHLLCPCCLSAMGHSTLEE